jgi:hypothetical protein
LSLKARISLSRLRTAEAGVATTDTFLAIGRVFSIDAWKLRQLVEAENDRFAGATEVRP